MLNINEKHEN